MPAYLVVTIYEFMHQLLVVELYLMIHVPGLTIVRLKSWSYNWPAKLILKQLLQDVYSRFIM